MGNAKQSSGGRALVVCAVVSVILFTVSCQTGDEGPLGMVRGAFQTVTSPIRHVGALAAAPFQGLGNVMTNLTADQATLSELEAENAQLRARNVELEEAAQSAERLQDLLDLRDSNDLQSTAARIISGSVDSWSSTVTIDKGSSDGVTTGMPVLSSSGVIGQVVSCGANTATVRLLSDENSSISAMVQSSRAQGMLEGSATGDVSLRLVRTSQEVAIGDVVITSGLGGVFPKGLPLGQVTSVENNPGDLYLDISVELFADAENEGEVLVVTSLTEEQRASAEDIAEADAQETSGSQQGSDEDSEDGSSDGANQSQDDGTSQDDQTE
ncbi:rod shape-determining protein MreC [Thermophilibacter provencensis]|uniref:Cell shape-determining protein MreC n=1 Tax=Thermophilibacter provencensis TaxID=1852386 RepID=A0ABT7V2U2_9ACTN|nr:rod shape-determining protein MreC [Thermophilibacter provencensis]MDM8270918.1 rod shape-determining protein MreC [Thermophilibacter provencensis]